MKRIVEVGRWDIPFEFVGKIASSCAVAKASHVEGGATARHIAG